MEDAEIVELFWARDESAIGHAKAKYGGYCHAIASRVLDDGRDVEECLNDTYLGAWNAMPPHRPTVLRAFLGKIARNLSLKRWRTRSALKRGSGVVAVSLDELEECLPACLPATGEDEVGRHLEAEELAGIVNAFLAGLPSDQRRIFMCRYWHFDSIADIAARLDFTESKVKMTLKRTRERLAEYLEKEGVVI